MKWKLIGQTVIGTSHLRSGKICEDALDFDVIFREEKEILLCCMSDGAGSAKYAADASNIATQHTIQILKNLIQTNKLINEAAILTMAESIYDLLKERSEKFKVPINELSCTLLGCVLFEESSVFFQIGDGVIIREDNSRNYTSIWLPQNGEYSNTTNFLIDDINFGNLKIATLDEPIHEVALTTDGLQILILNNETDQIHQPFFRDLFKWLRFAEKPEQLEILNKKLESYLSSETINKRTDDDKTLFLATRLNNA